MVSDTIGVFEFAEVLRKLCPRSHSEVLRRCQDLPRTVMFGTP
jgi:hypothetical protein